jgi:hypothetical protein
MKSGAEPGFGAVELYGWESKGQFWHGPTELTTSQNQIERVLANERHRSIVFALSSSCCDGDMSIPVSEHIEHLATELVHWLRARDSKRRVEWQRGSGPILSAQPNHQEPEAHDIEEMHQRSRGRRSRRSEDRKDVPA